MQRTGDYTHIAGGIQITEIYSEPQRNCCDEETVRSSDRDALIILCHQFLEKWPHRPDPRLDDGFANTLTPPNRLENYPGQPELMRDG